MSEWYGGTWYAPRIINRGDLVQNRVTGRVGVVNSVVETGLLNVAVIGAKTPFVRLWSVSGVDLIHGTLRITERL